MKAGREGLPVNRQGRLHAVDARTNRVRATPYIRALHAVARGCTGRCTLSAAAKKGSSPGRDSARGMVQRGALGIAPSPPPGRRFRRWLVGEFWEREAPSLKQRAVRKGVEVGVSHVGVAARLADGKLQQ
jgi:hypothetical protein